MDQIIYQLTIDDVQNVALQELGEELTLEEIKDIEDLISWFGHFSSGIRESAG